MATHIAIALADGSVLSGDIKTVALAFLMLELGPVAFGEDAPTEPARAPHPFEADIDPDDELAPELDDPSLTAG